MYAWVYIVFAVVNGFFLYVIKRSCSFFTHNQLTFIGNYNIGMEIIDVLIQGCTRKQKKTLLKLNSKNERLSLLKS